ncbi:META domain-containing protein [Paracidovorax sp. MALMAid1276]|uniref:META domain-containing protein n=1 Tax=Paracidovorax sp. MALMAid1276 TaxID=3411631 RepID=UPI003B999D00
MPRLDGATVRQALRLLLLSLPLVLAGCATRPPESDAVVTGMALARERVMFPPEAVFEATLLDVSQPDQPPVVLGRQRSAPAGQPPFALAIPYPSSHFAPKGRYEVRATVSLEDRLLWTTHTRTPVPQDPAYRRVSLQLLRVPLSTATVEAAVPLALTHWRLVELEGEPVPPPAEGSAAPHLVLQADEPRAMGSGGCNRFLVDYALRGGQLRFGGLVSGIALCLASGATEQRFFKALGAVQGFRLQGRQLLLRDEEGQPLMRLEAAETPLQ